MARSEAAAVIDAAVAMDRVISEICRLADGLPLAGELMRTRQSQSVTQLRKPQMAIGAGERKKNGTHDPNPARPRRG
jgi:hypothetical protein